MNSPIRTRTFTSGNSVAVRLPKGFAIPANTEIELAKSGDTVTIRIAENREAVRKALGALSRDLAAIGHPADGIQPRPDFEAPVRRGL